jgi:hypothetical protein
MLIETEKTGGRAGRRRPGAIELDPLDVANLETLRQLREGQALGSRFQAP